MIQWKLFSKEGLVQIADTTFNDYLVALGVCFILGLLIKRFLYNRMDHYDLIDSKNLNTDNEDESDRFGDIKMVFVCKIDGKASQTALAEKIAYVSVELYKKVLYGDSEIHKKILDHWDTFGSKKIVLKIKEDSELEDIIKNVKIKNLPYFRHPTEAIIAIGPESSNLIDFATSHLKLLS